MWFDAQAALAEIEGGEKSLSNLSLRATCATMATQDAGDLSASHMSHMSHAHSYLETASSGPWGAADWQAYYHERAGVAEFDGGQPRREAEAQAFEGCIAEWLCRNPVPSSEPGTCVWCGRGDMPGQDVLPSWLHSECRGAWYARRRQDAITALAGFGIVSDAVR